MISDRGDDLGWGDKGLGDDLGWGNDKDFGLTVRGG